MIAVQVKFFAMCRDVTKRDEESMALPDAATVEGFWKKIILLYPALEKYRAASRVAVNREYVPPERVLENGDEICIIPPVSGG